MNIKPIVSICCLVYNQEKYVKKSIEGIINQRTTFPIEIIIHDDASIDGTKNIIREFEDKYPNIIRPIYQSINQYSKGIRPSTAFVFPRCQGKYIAICEGDDYWIDPNKLQMQIDFLENNENYVGCFTDYSFCDVDGKIILHKVRNEDYVSEYDQYSILEAGVPQSCIVVYRNIPEVYSVMREMPVVNGDQLLAALMARYGNIKYIPKVTAARRLGSGIFSTLSRKNQSIKMIDTFLVLKEYFTDDRSKAAIDIRLRNIYSHLIYDLLLRMQFKDALRFNKERKEKIDLPLKNIFSSVFKMIYKSISYKTRRIINKF